MKKVKALENFEHEQSEQVWYRRCVAIALRVEMKLRGKIYNVSPRIENATKK